MYIQFCAYSYIVHLKVIPLLRVTVLLGRCDLENKRVTALGTALLWALGNCTSSTTHWSLGILT